MAYDVETIRRQFPGLARREGDHPAIFLDNPAGTQIAQIAVDRMVDTMLHRNANHGAPFITSRLASQCVADAHAAAADFLNTGDPGEIFFGQSMTALTFGLSRSLGREFERGDEIILSQTDHDGNIAPWLMLAEEKGLRVKWLEFDTATFEFDLSRLQNLLSRRTKLVAVGYASNVTGTINDIPAIARICREAGTLLCVDAVQFAPHGVIDVQQLGCDFLVCSAYKFFGPHYAVMWGRRELLERLTAYKVRPATEALPSKFVNGTAVAEALAGVTGAIDYYAWVGQQFGTPTSNHRRAQIVAAIAVMAEHDGKLMSFLLDGIGQLKGTRIFGISDPARSSRRVPTISFTIEGFAPAAITQHMADRGIYMWNGNCYAVELCRALNLLDSGGVARIGLTHYNTLAEAERFLDRLKDMVVRKAA